MNELKDLKKQIKSAMETDSKISIELVNKYNSIIESSGFSSKVLTDKFLKLGFELKLGKAYKNMGDVILYIIDKGDHFYCIICPVTNTKFGRGIKVTESTLLQLMPTQLMELAVMNGSDYIRV